MSLNDASPTGHSQLDALLTLMRQPLPGEADARKKTFEAVRKAMSELQSNITQLTPAQVKRLHACISEYESRTKTVQDEIHGDLNLLRDQVIKTHGAPAAAPAPAATPGAAPAGQPAMTLQQYEDSMFPNPAQRTGIGWTLRHVGYMLHRIGSLFRRRTAGGTGPAAVPPPPVPETAATTGGTDIETLPLVRGQPQNLLTTFANRGLLRLGDARLSIVRAGTGVNEKYFFDIGAKRYQLVINDNAYEGGPLADTDVSRELFANQGGMFSNTGVQFQDGSVVIIGEGNHPFGGPRGGRTYIPRNDFINMVQEVVKQQAAGATTVTFNNVSVRYTGRIQTGPGGMSDRSTPFRGPVDQPARVIPSIRFVEVPRS